MWAGTMGPEPTVGNTVPYQGAFYSLDTYSHDAEPHILNVSISNGLAWNAAGDVLYWIDTPTLNVYAFDFDVDSAEISNQRSVFNFTANNVTGFPDGMTIDSDGNLWVACFSGGQVINVDPRTSRLLQTVKIPAERVTSAMFGGPQLDTLFVTTSRFGLTDDQLLQQPLAGSVFAVTGLGVGALAPANKAVRPEALTHHTL
uniref:Regucalcin n=2 Tax=Timema TaxID=61471 RepID=A0A7R9IUQ0_9NEOP|nr:unnamed protein product [Timema bartmani]CAD7464760.1 unnamed protein product [Timema tahoe]